MRIIRNVLLGMALCILGACDDDDALERHIEAAEEYQEHHFEAREAAARGDLREAQLRHAEAVGERDAVLRGADPLGEEIQGQIAEEAADEELERIEEEEKSSPKR